ncbi:alpha/beta hydrolase family protein [Streptomyces sp. NPDC002779]|uniref:alpha/beta hydrolase family protein n=1 Tax=Streptomyces sp. NPDC002779 TaxID=3364664 RepID=UPI0036A208B8
MKVTGTGRAMRHHTALVAAALLALTSCGQEPAPAPRAAVTAVPALPEPTGTRPVGLRVLELRDTSRRDPWDPARARELMVSLWYPARHGTTPAARYVTRRESELILRAHRVKGVPADLLSRVRVHADRDAPPAETTGRGLPLVVLSPGFSLPRTSLTALAEDLASRGYAAAAVDHAFEAVAVSRPGGRVTECRACHGSPDGRRVAAVRAADLSYVRRRLLALSGADRRGMPRLDPARVAAVGHSMGGAAAFEAVRADPGFAAGADLDGTLHSPGTAPVTRPFLFLGADEHGRPGADRTWEQAWQRLSGWRRWYSVAGTGHVSFTDYGLLGERLGLAAPGTARDAADALGTTRRLVGAFLDDRLRGAPASGPDAIARDDARIRRHDP